MFKSFLMAASVLFFTGDVLAQMASDAGQQVPSLEQARRGQDAKGQPLRGAKPLPPVSAQASPSGYDSAKATIYPLSVEQVRQWQDTVDEQKRAARAKIKSVPTTGAVTVDLTPGVEPPFVRAAPFLGATVTFIDALGNPWQVKHITNFSQEDFKVESPFKGSNALTISNLGSYGQGSITVFLDGFETPIPILIFGGQKETDVRRDFRIPRKRPGSSDVAPASVMASAKVDRRLGDILDGVIPTGATTLKTTDAEVRAWQLDDLLVIRTTATLMSQFKDRLPSQDGTVVYSMAMTPIITISSSGVPRQVGIEF